MTAGARLPRRKGFEATRPPDASDDRWQAALRGLSAFVAGGWADQAERLGWTRDELFRVPELWSQIHLTGAALLIGDSEVIEVTPTEIRIRTPSGATQSFYRRPAVDYRPRVRDAPLASAAITLAQRRTSSSGDRIRGRRISQDAAELGEATRN